MNILPPSQLRYSRPTILLHEETIQELFADSIPHLKERIQAQAMAFDLTMQPA
ncbi:hypothetical protein [Spirosoma humi]